MDSHLKIALVAQSCEVGGEIDFLNSDSILEFKLVFKLDLDSNSSLGNLMFKLQILQVPRSSKVYSVSNTDKER